MPAEYTSERRTVSYCHYIPLEPVDAWVEERTHWKERAELLKIKQPIMTTAGEAITVTFGEISDWKPYDKKSLKYGCSTCPLHVTEASLDQILPLLQQIKGVSFRFPERTAGLCIFGKLHRYGLGKLLTEDGSSQLQSCGIGKRRILETAEQLRRRKILLTPNT